MRNILPSRQDKDALKLELGLRLDVAINSLNYSRISPGLYKQETIAGCKFVKIKYLTQSRSWPTFWVVFGYNNKIITNIYEELKGGVKVYDRKPMLASWVGHVVQRNFSSKERREMKAKYNCFPIGEWDIRSETELMKSDKVVDAIEAFEIFYFSQNFSMEYYAQFPENIRDENHKDFILLQIIAASKLGKKTRKAKLIEHYEKRKGYNPAWVNKLQDFDF